MTARTHDLAALSALGAFVLFEPLRAMTLSTVLVSLVANQLGGILPDIDQPTAPLWRNLPEGKFFGKLFGKSVGGHRFLTHSLLGVLIFGFLMRALLMALHPLMPHVNIGFVMWAFLIGIVSHLVMDTFTKEGVPWLLPLPTKLGLPPIKDLRVTTGGIIELGIIFPGIFALDAWLVTSHYGILLNFVHHYIV